jgi:hypothetical protein
MGAVGVFAGDGMAMGVLVGTPLALASVELCRYLDRDEKLGLVTTFAIALVLRWAVAALIQILVYHDHPGLFAPDETAYEPRGHYLSEYLAGHVPPSPDNEATLTWFIGWTYYIFGYGPLIPKFIHGVLGAWTAAFTTLIGARLFSADVGRRAGILAAIFPSLVLWASIDVKDIWTLVGSQLALYCFILLRERLRIWLLPLLGLGFVAVVANRPYQIVMLGTAMGLSTILVSPRKIVRNLLIGAVIGAMLYGVARSSNVDALSYNEEDQSKMSQVTAIRGGYNDEAGSAVDTTLVDTSTPLGLALWVPIGLVYFFLAPIPFTGKSIISLATSPEMILWYLLMPALIRGFLAMLREKRLVTCLPTLLYLGAASAAWGIVVTNVGSLYRYRAQVLFFMLILIAQDQVRRRQATFRRHLAATPPLPTAAPVAPKPWWNPDVQSR